MVINGGFPGLCMLICSYCVEFLYPNKKSWHNVHAFPVKPKILLETFFIKSIF